MSEIVPYIADGEAVPQKPSLDKLLERANQEHHLVEEALGQALDHVIKAGEILLELREQFAKGGWDNWAEENFHGGRLVASYYMRIATYKEHVQGLPNVGQAMKSLRGMPALRRPRGLIGYDESVKEEARSLAAEGMKNTEIGRILDIDYRTVGRWIDPEILRRHRERTREQHYKEREARLKREAEARQRAAEREARRVGGSLAESYSLVHKLEAPLARAAREATDPEVRVLLTEAIRAHHIALDKIVKALGAS